MNQLYIKRLARRVSSARKIAIDIATWCNDRGKSAATLFAMLKSAQGDHQEISDQHISALCEHYDNSKLKDDKKYYSQMLSLIYGRSNLENMTVDIVNSEIARKNAFAYTERKYHGHK